MPVKTTTQKIQSIKQVLQNSTLDNQHTSTVKTSKQYMNTSKTSVGRQITGSKTEKN